MKMLFLINTSVEEDFPEEEMPKASGRKNFTKGRYGPPNT